MLSSGLDRWLRWFISRDRVVIKDVIGQGDQQSILVSEHQERMGRVIDLGHPCLQTQFYIGNRPTLWQTRSFFFVRQIMRTANGIKAAALTIENPFSRPPCLSKQFPKVHCSHRSSKRIETRAKVFFRYDELCFYSFCLLYAVLIGKSSDRVCLFVCTWESEQLQDRTNRIVMGWC